MNDYVVNDYGHRKLGEFIDVHRTGRLQASEMTEIASDLVKENEVLLAVLNIIAAMNVDPSSIRFHPNAILGVMRNCFKSNELTHAHLLRFADEAAEFLEARLGHQELTLEQARADALGRLQFMAMVTSVLSEAEVERRAA